MCRDLTGVVDALLAMSSLNDSGDDPNLLPCFGIAATLLVMFLLPLLLLRAKK